MRYTISLVGFSIFLAVIMQVPQWKHVQNPEYKGLLVELNSDEAIYLARVQESLSGRPEQSAEAFLGDSSVQGSQFAFIEKWYGNMFRFTGWNAAEVLQLMDSVIPVLIFLSLFFFLQLCGFEKKYALIGATIFCLCQLYNLSRPIHMRASFLLMLWSLIGVTAAYRRQWWGVLIGGGLLGLLVGVYVWSFVFAWMYWGILLCIALLEWMTPKKQSTLQRFTHRISQFFHHRHFFGFQIWHFLLMTGLIGGIAAIPAITQYITLVSHPLYAFAKFRSGIHPSHLPESFIYSGLFLVMTLGVVMTYIKHRSAMKRYIPVVALIITALVYMNQQVIHGHTFNFVSHGIFSLMLAAISVAVLPFLLRPKWLVVSAAAAAVYIAAITYDGRYIIKQWSVQESQFAQQHVASAIAVLNDMPRMRILSDPETSALIASHTKHDVLYSIYLKNTLMTHEEIALRYCLTQLPLPSALRRIKEEQHLVYPDAVSAFKGNVREHEVALVTALCADLDLDPGSVMDTFGVTDILWNKVSEPDWNISRINKSLTLIQETDTWALYHITP